MTRVEPQSGGIQLEYEILAQVNFACAQNQAPVLHRLVVHNTSETRIEGVRVTMRVTPPVIREKSWHLDSIAAHARHEISDTSVELDVGLLKGLDEAEFGEVEFLVEGERLEPITERAPIKLLARDEWGGLSDMPQLLAAFVSPNERAVAKLLKDASRLLEEKGHDGALNGYQSGDPRRVYMLVAAIWSAATGLGLSYAEPPASFENAGQKIRGAARIVDEGLATCLDLALLLAAAFEAAGINPVILFAEDHAWVAAWIQHTDFGHVKEPDVVAVRKAVQAHELVPIEATLLTRRPAVDLQASEDAGRLLLSEDRETEFLMAIDIKRARAARILPQASEAAPPHAEAEPVAESAPAALPEVPDFGQLPGEEIDEAPQSPQGKIERWQRKLLDLSLRNRLLNFRDSSKSKQAVPFLCNDIAALEDALADNQQFQAVSLHQENPIGDRKLSPEDSRRVEEQFAREAHGKKQIVVPLTLEEMNKRLLMLYRRANSDMQEGGTNTLFLAVGFLRWKRSQEDNRSYRAPLILIPVKLLRRSARSPFRIAHHEDDVRFNATLIEFLKRDFHIHVNAFDEDLPRDESGIDVEHIFRVMRHRVKDVAGFEVVEDIALSTFSFTKYLMWKDLVDRTDQLRDNRLVRHLIDGLEDDWNYGQDSPAVRPDDIDRQRYPDSLFTPLPTDSSQLAAVIAAAEGRTFYLVGPPGTGKSQTITNMISQCLAEGKTVLFVAEKAAALDVVHRRLVASGLGDGVLELHSNKTDRRSVLAQLGRGWDRSASQDDSNWLKMAAKVTLHRDRLNEYVQALHAKGTQGFSVFAAIGRLARMEKAGFEVSFASKDAHDEASYARLVELAEETASVHQVAVQGPALMMVEKEEWSFRWQDEFLHETVSFRASLVTLRAAHDQISRALGLRQDTELTVKRRDCIRALADCVSENNQDISTVPEIPAGLLKEMSRTLAQDAEGFLAARSKLDTPTATYALKTLRRMPLDELDAAWRTAGTRLWPASFFARRQVRKHLQTYAESGSVNPSADLEALRSAKEFDDAIQANPLAAIARVHECWNVNRAKERVTQAQRGVERAKQLVELAIAWRQAVAALRNEVDNPSRYDRVVADLVRGVDAHTGADLKRYLEAEQSALSNGETFVASGGCVPNGATVVDIEQGLETILSEKKRLSDWTTWMETRNRAIANGLGPFVEALADGCVNGAVAEAFECAYAAWWLPLAMDDHAQLRQFRHWDHEKRIALFRELQDEVASITPREVMRRIRHGLPARDATPRKSELGVLRHQLGLKRPSMPIRKLLEALPETFGKLAPCVLMSPLSVAQYLPASGAAFDVVIFDEASQVTTWDAIGAIARGRQTIVVGDPKQLPPTNFFGRADDEDDDLPEIERDLPSILEEVRAAGIPSCDLVWHYRSRDEALIAFSNRFYYNGRLVTFPAPKKRTNALQLHKVEGTYARGHSGRVNHREGKAVANMVRDRLLNWLQLPEDERFTLGVITFNTQQQSFIQDQLDAMRRKHPEIEWFFEEDREEPVIVKNLENIQGDERDLILFSVTFGPDARGKLSMNFGPLNNSGGERRLNVAVTRARREMHVFSSIRADQIDLGRTNATGVRDLKAFLDYAERGSTALGAHEEGSLEPTENVFEAAVADALERKGWEVRTQVGVSAFRIDLAIVHPDRAGSYLCGIECDGASYHDYATARDRDKVRQAVLEGLGWSILRIWSTDWFKNPGAVIDRVHDQIKQLLETDREPRPPESSEEPSAEIDAWNEQDVRQAEAHSVPTEEAQQPSAEINQLEPKLNTKADREQDQTGALALNPEQFFEASYATVIEQLIIQIVQSEGPMTLNRLARRVAQDHGWQRTGRRILEQVRNNLGRVERHKEFEEIFVWAPGCHRPRVPFRGLRGRQVQDVSRTEIASVIDDLYRQVEAADDPMLVLARRLGIARLSASARSYLEACAAWRESGETTPE